MTAALLLAALLAILAHGWWTGRSFAARVAALAGRASRPRMLFGWAAGIWAAYGLSALAALILLGRSEAIVVMPGELVRAAWALGLPARADPGDLREMLATLALGAGLGIALLWWHGRRGLPAWGISYRSPAAAQGRGDWPGAIAMSLAAGVGEELFFRLVLPLLVAIVSGSGVAGVAVGLAAFVAMHRYQGVAGMIAVGLVGAVLTMLYLATGLLWVAMLLHVAIDLNALIVRPALAPR